MSWGAWLTCRRAAEGCQAPAPRCRIVAGVAWRGVAEEAVLAAYKAASPRSVLLATACLPARPVRLPSHAVLPVSPLALPGRPGRGAPCRSGELGGREHRQPAAILLHPQLRGRLPPSQRLQHAQRQRAGGPDLGTALHGHGPKVYALHAQAALVAHGLQAPALAGRACSRRRGERGQAAAGVVDHLRQKGWPGRGGQEAPTGVVHHVRQARTRLRGGPAFWQASAGVVRHLRLGCSAASSHGLSNACLTHL